MKTILASVLVILNASSGWAQTAAQLTRIGGAGAVRGDPITVSHEVAKNVNSVSRLSASRHDRVRARNLPHGYAAVSSVRAPV